MTTETRENETGRAQQRLLDGETVDRQSSSISGGSSVPYLLSARWKVAYMGLFYGTINYMLRVNISIALPFMVKSTSQSTSANDTHAYTVTNISAQTNTSMAIDEVKLNGQCLEVGTSLTESLSAEFNWSKQTQALVLSAIYYGYLFQFPFGWLAGKYGGKHIISVAMALSAVLTLLIPVLARWSVYAVIADRFLLGLALGATFAAMYKLVSQWALPNERSRFVAILWFGCYLGLILGFFTSGFLCAHGFDNGWGSVFYVHGAIAVIFVLLWLYVVFDSPEVHPRISTAELKLLTSSSHGTTFSSKKLTVPWRRMLTYRPVLVVFITHVLQCHVFYTVISCVPLYMKAVLKFDIQKVLTVFCVVGGLAGSSLSTLFVYLGNGLFLALPSICCCVGVAVSGVFGDHIITKKWMSPTATRKLVQVIGLIGTGAFILVPGFLACHQRGWVVVCLCACMLLNGIGEGAGFPCSPVDMSPRYGSIIFGISNSIATIAGIIAPVIVAALTENDTAEEWRSVFLIATGAAILGALVFGFFSSSDLAPWATEPPTELEVFKEPSGKFAIKNISASNDELANDLPV